MCRVSCDLFDFNDLLHRSNSLLIFFSPLFIGFVCGIRNKWHRCVYQPYTLTTHHDAVLIFTACDLRLCAWFDVLLCVTHPKSICATKKMCCSFRVNPRSHHHHFLSNTNFYSSDRTNLRSFVFRFRSHTLLRFSLCFADWVGEFEVIRRLCHNKSWQKKPSHRVVIGMVSQSHTTMEQFDSRSF